MEVSEGGIYIYLWHRKDFLYNVLHIKLH